MDLETLDVLIKKYIAKNLTMQATDSSITREKIIEMLLTEAKVPDKGLDKLTIEMIINFFANLDSNNHINNIGIGEREGRVFSELISKRNYRYLRCNPSLSHGIGRSGDLTETQPKAIGSSIMYQITNKMINDILQFSGMKSICGCIVVPMATGMTLALCMRSLSRKRRSAKYVIWSRIDQKSCFKSILVAGFEPIIIENVLNGYEINTNIFKMEEVINSYGSENIVCIMSTTSCFAPRSPDDVKSLGNLCMRYDIPHIINNAYGVQIKQYCHEIFKAITNSRVDVIVQSTDKNFMVPVGGAIIASPSLEILKSVSNVYAGRASIAPIFDVFVTLLEMGKNKYQSLQNEREKKFEELKQLFVEIADEFGLELLSTCKNRISLSCIDLTEGISLKNLPINDPTMVGRKLFFKCVSGCRVVQQGTVKKIDDYEFKNWGSHIDNYPCDYLACAAAIGMSGQDLITLNKRLRSVLKELMPHSR